jgi:hypothetical protein
LTFERLGDPERLLQPRDLEDLPDRIGDVDDLKVGAALICLALGDQQRGEPARVDEGDGAQVERKTCRSPCESILDGGVDVVNFGHVDLTDEVDDRDADVGDK